MVLWLTRTSLFYDDCWSTLGLFSPTIVLSAKFALWLSSSEVGLVRALHYRHASHIAVRRRLIDKGAGFRMFISHERPVYVRTGLSSCRVWHPQTPPYAPRPAVWSSVLLTALFVSCSVAAALSASLAGQDEGSAPGLRLTAGSISDFTLGGSQSSRTSSDRVRLTSTCRQKYQVIAAGVERRLHDGHPQPPPYAETTNVLKQSSPPWLGISVQTRGSSLKVSVLNLKYRDPRPTHLFT